LLVRIDDCGDERNQHRDPCAHDGNYSPHRHSARCCWRLTALRWRTIRRPSAPGVPIADTRSSRSPGVDSTVEPSVGWEYEYPSMSRSARSRCSKSPVTMNSRSLIPMCRKQYCGLGLGNPEQSLVTRRSRWSRYAQAERQESRHEERVAALKVPEVRVQAPAEMPVDDSHFVSMSFDRCASVRLSKNALISCSFEVIVSPFENPGRHSFPAAVPVVPVDRRHSQDECEVPRQQPRDSVGSSGAAGPERPQRGAPSPAWNLERYGPRNSRRPATLTFRAAVSSV
jgi:hypothetical protein